MVKVRLSRQLRKIADRQIHGAVALLSLFYLTVAILPWSYILFF